MRKFILPSEIVIANNEEVVTNLNLLPKVGAGVDGILLRYNDEVLKILKTDFSNPNTYRLSMNYDKLLFFKDNLHLSRITKPTGVLYNIDGKYIGYTMDYLDDVVASDKMSINDFTCGDLYKSIIELHNDFDELTKNNVVVKDLNTNSYIFTTDFLHLCDMDRYLMNAKVSVNENNLKFVFAKFLYLGLTRDQDYDRYTLRQLSRCVRRCCNSRGFLDELVYEVDKNKELSIGEFLKTDAKKILCKK